jgi:hypothetical protein
MASPGHPKGRSATPRITLDGRALAQRHALLQEAWYFLLVAGAAYAAGCGDVGRALLGAESDTVRARAAMAILDQARQHVELDDLAARVQALEEQAESIQPPRGRSWSA